MERPHDRWRDVATRLIADTSLLDRGFEHDPFGNLGPSKPMGAYLLEAGRLVITRLADLTQRLDDLYGEQLDPATRDRLHTAQQQLHAAAEALTGLPEELHAHYRGDGASPNFTTAALSSANTTSRVAPAAISSAPHDTGHERNTRRDYGA